MGIVSTNKNNMTYDEFKNCKPHIWNLSVFQTKNNFHSYSVSKHMPHLQESSRDMQEDSTDD